MNRIAFVIVLVAPLIAAAQPTPDPAAGSGSGSGSGSDSSAGAPAPPPPAPPPVTAVAPAPPPPAPPPAAPTEEEQEADYNYEPWSAHAGGYIQPQFRMRQDSPAAGDEDGFRMARVRPTITASGSAGNLQLSAYLEAELQPQFTLYDAFATVSRPLSHHGSITLDAGQMRVPISRQQLMSDSRLAFVDKAQLASIAPDRDLGVRLGYVPSQLNKVKLIGGAFNGDGRNLGQNVNQAYLFAGRVEITPIGQSQPYQESAFSGKWVSLGLSIGRNRLTPAEYHEDLLILGADVSGSWKGLSGSFEYLEVRHSFSGDPMKLPGPNFNANGFVVQANYMLPVKLPPLHQSRFELGARVEEIDRNDAVPITQLGDANQSQRIYTAVLSFYMRQHLLKAQLAASHIEEIEDRTAVGANATYDNDQLLLQVTYRVE